MNIMAMMGAGAGTAMLLISIFFGEQHRQAWARLLYLAAGVGLALIMAAMVPVLFGDTSVATSSLAIEYLIYSSLAGSLLAGPALSRQAQQKAPGEFTAKARGEKSPG